MRTDEFSTLTALCVNFLALADNPLAEFGKAAVKCPTCGEIVAEITGVVQLANGEVLVPVVTFTAIAETGAALAAHSIAEHPDVVRDVMAAAAAEVAAEKRV